MSQTYLCFEYSVNGGPSTVIDQPDSGGGNVVISVPVKVNFNSGANSITFASGQSSKSRGQLIATSFED